MSTAFFVALVRPFMLLVLALIVLTPARKAVERWMPNGRAKRLLLRRVN